MVICGAWSSVKLDGTVIPTCQFDNWDIKPLHAVKVDGKEMRKVNGALLQGAVRGGKHQKPNGTTINGNSMEWRKAETHGTREQFFASFTSLEHAEILENFNDVVFGLAIFNRSRLFGGERRSEINLNTRINNEFDSLLGSSVNFRTLLHPAFKPHGGKPVGGETLFDNSIVYV